MSGPADLGGICDELLALAVAAVATTSSPPDDLRSFVALGDPPFDCCPQLTVHWRQGVKDTASPTQAPLDRFHRLVGGSVNLVDLVVTMLRCQPQIEGNKLPDPADLTAAANLSSEDGWAIWNEVQAAFRAGTLFAGFPCRPAYISPLIPVTPQGGCGGVAFNMGVELGGYLNP